MATGIRTSNPPSYDKIFSIFLANTQVIASGATLPGHRALYIVATATAEVTFTNIDGTTAAVRFASGTQILLPLQIKSYTTTGMTGPTSLYIYGLI